ncbi:MAG: hypothetical protein E7374_01220 [Clostridiales bacterium]|nr:hypothetical protein [Clostridiales bacterium]
MSRNTCEPRSLGGQDILNDYYCVLSEDGSKSLCRRSGETSKEICSLNGCFVYVFDIGVLVLGKSNPNEYEYHSIGMYYNDESLNPLVLDRFDTEKRIQKLKLKVDEEKKKILIIAKFEDETERHITIDYDEFHHKVGYAFGNARYYTLFSEESGFSRKI